MLRGLIVREPYATLIVKGIKRWEIRKSNTRIRGFIVIVSGGYAKGVVELYDSKGPFTPEELEEYEEFHRVPKEFLRKYAADKNLYVWMLRNAVAFKRPVKITMPKGAQVWVRIREEHLIFEELRRAQKASPLLKEA